MYRKIILILVAIIFSGAACNQTKLGDKGNERQTPDMASMFSVQELLASQNIPETFGLRGYILDKYVCPPCPTQGLCQPCLSSDYVVVADKFSGVKGYSETDPQIKLFFKPHDESFQLNTLYDFSVIKRSNVNNPAVKDYWVEYYNIVPLEE